jgi:hypothetical protein
VIDHRLSKRSLRSIVDDLVDEVERLERDNIDARAAVGERLRVLANAAEKISLPYCFNVGSGGRFCLEARDWAGHAADIDGGHHAFVSLADAFRDAM